VIRALVLLLMVLVVAGCAGAARVSDAPASSVQDLGARIGALPRWPHELRDFTEAEWDAYLQVARAVQRTDPAIVEGLLKWTDIGDPRPFILMRVVFELSQEEGTGGGAGWLGPSLTDGRLSEKATASWPIAWDATGRPRLIASSEGYSGVPPNWVEEYRWLLGHVPFRKLGERGQ
jgi:outer membrane murein-binding lipoprotein Lpp